MKKITTLSLLVAMSAFVFSFLPVQAEELVNTTTVSAMNTSASVNDEALEKILSPEYLKYFRVIKKENGALYGVRLHSQEQLQLRDQSKEGNIPMLDSSNNILEKIPSPDQIKYFKVMKKENGALFGIRLSSEQAGTANQNSLANAKAQLEKILAPQFINLYEKIQKIGDSLWGVKKEDDNKPVVKPRLVTAAMVECVSKAIDKKDEALKNRLTLTSEAINTAITVRGECQKEAIKSTENQLENLKVCLQNFKSKTEEIKKQAKDEQKIIWQSYQADLKACSALDPAVTTSTESNETLELMIEDGGNESMEALLNQ